MIKVNLQFFGGRGGGSGMSNNSAIGVGRNNSNLSRYSQQNVNDASRNAQITNLGDGDERVSARLGDDLTVSVNISKVDGGYIVEGSSTVFPYITGARNSARAQLHHQLMKATGRA